MGLSRDADTQEIVFAINGLTKTVEALTKPRWTPPLSIGSIRYQR